MADARRFYDPEPGVVDDARNLLPVYGRDAQNRSEVDEHLEGYVIAAYPHQVLAEH
jgi:hypothetical protein